MRGHLKQKCRKEKRYEKDLLSKSDMPTDIERLDEYNVQCAVVSVNSYTMKDGHP